MNVQRDTLAVDNDNEQILTCYYNIIIKDEHGSEARGSILRWLLEVKEYSS